jgi:hypothetical protein
MAWRVIAHGDQVWHVDAVAERRANTAAWQLMLSFRAATAPARPQAVWASKSSLYIQAERIPDAALLQLLTERLA